MNRIVENILLGFKVIEKYVKGYRYVDFNK